MVHSEVYLNKYAVSIVPSQLFIACFRFNFSSIFQGTRLLLQNVNTLVSYLTPFAPMCGRPCRRISVSSGLETKTAVSRTTRLS